jgi:hypothetical protein
MPLSPVPGLRAVAPHLNPSEEESFEERVVVVLNDRRRVETSVPSWVEVRACPQSRRLSMLLALHAYECPLLAPNSGPSG